MERVWKGGRPVAFFLSFRGEVSARMVQEEVLVVVL